MKQAHEADEEEEEEPQSKTVSSDIWVRNSFSYFTW